MTGWKFKLWRTAGAAALLGVSACGQAATTADTSAPAATAGAAGEAAIGESGSEGGGEAGVSMAFAGLTGEPRTALRLQQLKGFLMAAERVAEGDRPVDAALLVEQGLLEAYDPNAAEFGGLDVAPVRAATNGDGVSRQQMAQKIQAAYRVLDGARGRLTYNPADLAVRMIDLSTGLYQHVNQPDLVDPTEYQHSLGAALAARDVLVAGEHTLRQRNAAAYDEALREINRFIELWPAPSAPERPTPYQQVLAQSSRVRLALSPFL